jgi:hypothetical protein
MRTAMFCALCATLATVSLSCNQANAATLTVHTDVPAVKVHVPPPKANIHTPSPTVHDLTVTKGTNFQSLKTTSAHQLDKNKGNKGKGVTLYPCVKCGEHFREGTLIVR